MMTGMIRSGEVGEEEEEEVEEIKGEVDPSPSNPQARTLLSLSIARISLVASIPSFTGS